MNDANDVVYTGLLNACVFHSISFNPHSHQLASIINVGRKIINKFIQKYGSNDDRLLAAVNLNEWWRALFSTRNCFGDQLFDDYRLLNTMQMFADNEIRRNSIKPIGITYISAMIDVGDKQTCVIDVSRYYRFYDRHGNMIRNVSMERDIALAKKAGYRVRLVDTSQIPDGSVKNR
jgi:hypothetical protein